jgi:hypothetical protein
VSRTLAQKTNFDGFPKPGELIEITGAHALEATDRAILNTLYQHAHDSGRLGEAGAEWEFPLARLRHSRHESNDRLDACLDRLMRVIVNVPFTGPDGEPRVLKTHLFDFFDLPSSGLNGLTSDAKRIHEMTAQALPDLDNGNAARLKNIRQLPDNYLLPKVAEVTAQNEDLRRAQEASAAAGKQVIVRYGIPKLLQPLLTQSNRWGRIKAEVVHAMTSKYAIALYEMVQLRANMNRCMETFPIDRFRDLLGVPPGGYRRGNDFVRNVIEPARLEVNGLSDISADLQPRRRSKFAPIEAVTVVWRRKEGDDFRAAMQERNRSKIGRMARLKGVVETVAPRTALALPAE